jgi:hypothetical protein
MDRLNDKIRFAIALIQLALFHVGLTYCLELPKHFHKAPAFEISWLEAAMDAEATRRPPRWPGRNKMHKGLAVREAAAVKPLARVV